MTPSRALPRALGVARAVARRGVASDARATPRETSRASWALLLPSVAAGALGAWQLARREEKLAATTARAACLERVVDASRIRAGADDGARARVEGEMDLARTARVGPRARSVCGVAVPGSLIVTPVRLRAKKRGWFGRGASAAAGEAETVLLLRGWAPDAWTDADAEAGACAKTGAWRAGASERGGSRRRMNREKIGGFGWTRRRWRSRAGYRETRR